MILFFFTFVIAFTHSEFVELKGYDDLTEVQTLITDTKVIKEKTEVIKQNKQNKTSFNAIKDFKTIEEITTLGMDFDEQRGKGQNQRVDRNKWQPTEASNSYMTLTTSKEEEEEDVILQAGEGLISKIVVKSKERKTKRKFQNQIIKENSKRSEAIKKSITSRQLGEEEEKENKLENPGGMDYTLIMEREAKRGKEGDTRVVVDAFKEERKEKLKNKNKIRAQKTSEFYKRKNFEESLLQ